MKLMQSLIKSKKIKFTNKIIKDQGKSLKGNPDFEPFWNTWIQSDYKNSGNLPFVNFTYDVPDIEAIYLKLKYPDIVEIDET